MASSPSRIIRVSSSSVIRSSKPISRFRLNALRQRRRYYPHVFMWAILPCRPRLALGHCERYGAVVFKNGNAYLTQRSMAFAPKRLEQLSAGDFLIVHHLIVHAA